MNYGPLRKQPGFPGAGDKLRELVMGMSKVQKLKRLLSRTRFFTQTPRRV